MDMDSLDSGFKFFYDCADFLQRIKDTYTKGDETIGTFWNISTGMKVPSNVVGYRNEKIVEIALQNGVISNLKPIGGLWAKTNNFTAFTAKINWDRFQTNIELAHDLMTVTNEVWGRDKQKRFLKEKILERCRKYNQIEFELTEKTLGPFQEERANSNQDVQILRQSEINLETHIEFCRTIRALEEEKFLSVMGDIDFDINALFIHGPKNFLYGDDGYPHRFYPPEHCKVKIRVLAYEKEVEMQPVKMALELIKNDPDYLDRNRRAEDERVDRTAKRVIELAKGKDSDNNHNKFKFTSNLYDDKRSILKLFGKEIKIPTGINQDYLCQVIFLKITGKLNELEDFKKAKTGEKIWSWDEVVELSDGKIESRSSVPEKEKWRTVYNAARAVNDLIAKETTIKNFFLTNPIKTVKINPQYLH